MPKFVRVRLANGGEASVSPAFAAAHNLPIKKKPAAKNGRALAPKPPALRSLPQVASPRPLQVPTGPRRSADRPVPASTQQSANSTAAHTPEEKK